MKLDNEQINLALNDMYNVFSQLPIEAQELFTQKTCELMRQRNNTSFYCVSSFKTIHSTALSHGFRAEGRSVLEIGAGKPLGTGLFWNLVGARKYTSIDKFISVNLDELWLSRFQGLIDMNLSDTSDFKLDDFVKKNGDGYRLNRERIDLVRGDFGTYPLPLESFDLIYSIAVLEHVADVPAILKRMCHLLREDGLMIHIIDLREHHTHLRTVPDKNASVDFLKYSREEWERLYPPGSEYYINRRRASDFETDFSRAGFEIVDVMTTAEMNLNQDLYNLIHPDYRGYASDDLKRLGIVAVLRKRKIDRPMALRAARHEGHERQ